MVYMGLLTNFYEREYGCKHLLVIIDELTKFVEIFLLRNNMADDVAVTFFSEYICRYGVPEILITDNGREFVNRTSCGNYGGKEVSKLIGKCSKLLE